MGDTTREREAQRARRMGHRIRPKKTETIAQFQARLAAVGLQRNRQARKERRRGTPELVG